MIERIAELEAACVEKDRFNTEVVNALKREGSALRECQGAFTILCAGLVEAVFWFEQDARLAKDEVTAKRSADRAKACREKLSIARRGDPDAEWRRME